MQIRLIAVVAFAGIQIIASHASAQVIQLPSYRTFSYSGGASIPDSGTGFLGGTRYSSSGSTTRGWGPYAPRAAGRSSGGSSLSARVDIIDLAALDDAILNANVQRDPNAQSVLSAGSPAANGGRRFLSGTIQNSYQKPPTDPQDHNGYRRALAGHQPTIQHAATDSQLESDIRYYLSEGSKAERAGHILSARVYYGMAMDAMTPELLERYNRILAEKKAAKEKQKEANRPDRIKF